MIRLEGTWPSGPGIVIATTPCIALDGPLLAACLSEPILFLGGGSGIHGDPALEGGTLAGEFPDGVGGRASLPSKTFRDEGSRPVPPRRRKGGPFSQRGDQSD